MKIEVQRYRKFSFWPKISWCWFLNSLFFKFQKWRNNPCSPTHMSATNVHLSSKEFAFIEPRSEFYWTFIEFSEDETIQVGQHNSMPRKTWPVASKSSHQVLECSFVQKGKDWFFKGAIITKKLNCIVIWVQNDNRCRRISVNTSSYVSQKQKRLTNRLGQVLRFSKNFEFFADFYLKQNFLLSRL